MSEIIQNGYNIAVRFSSLREKFININDVYAQMESEFVNCGGVIIFGPLFGGEAQDELIDRLKKLGLDYYDDFFELNIELPEWLCIRVNGS